MTNPSTSRLPATSVHSNDQVPRYSLIQIQINHSMESEALPTASELMHFVNRTFSSPKNEMLSQTLAVLILIKILLQQDNNAQSIGPIVDSCKKLKLVKPDEEFTHTQKEKRIEVVCEELKTNEDKIGLAICLFNIFSDKLRTYSGEKYLSNQAINIALCNIIYNTPINKKNASNIIDKKNSTDKTPLKDMHLLKRPFVAFGRTIYEIWISLLESIKAFAKAVWTFITSYTTAEGRKNRAFEKLKNDLLTHIIIYNFLCEIESNFI